MTQSPPSTTVSPRNKLLLQILTFLAIAILLYVSPKIEAWVNARSVTAEQSETASKSSANGSSVEADDVLIASNEREPSTSDSGHDSPSTDVTAKPQSRSSKSTSATKKSMAKESTAKESATEAKDSKATSAESAVSKTGSNKTSSTKSQSSASPNAQQSAAKKSDSQTGDSKTAKTQTADTKTADTQTAGTQAADTKNSESKKTSPKSSSVTRMKQTAPPKRQVEEPADSTPKDDASKAAENSDFGKLKEIRNNVFESTAGLVYRSGSADGHRLKHVMQHAKDNPGKPIHGVFIGEGDRDIVLALIDEAFDKASGGGKDVRREQQNDRLVLTVNMRRKVGYMGGQEGERKGNPTCTFIRIVLEKEFEVISAFPTNR